MEFESAHSNTTAKLPILKLGEYEMWVIRIKQYFQIQDYALWEVIENGNSWVSVPQTAQENGTSVTKMSVPVTAEEKTNKKNDVKARSLLLMALPNEHQLTFSQYTDAKTIASSAESLDSIFNRLQKIVSRLAILGVVIAQEDLNSNFLNSLPPEWNTHVVVWMNKAEIETMSIDDLYNNFKIIEQSVKKSVGASSGAQNLAFMTAPSTSSTNDVNTAIPAYEVSTASPNVNIASPQVSNTSFSDNVVYTFMIKNPNALSTKYEGKEVLSETGKKIFINANDTAGYDKSKQGNNEDISSMAMLAIDGVGFDWSDMAEEQVQTNMALMAFSDSEVYNDKTCSKTCLKNSETLKKQCDDLIVKLNQTEFIVATYKRGLATVEEQLITYRKNEVLFSEEVAVLKREVACKDYEINVLKSEFEKVKQEKEGIEFKIEKFNKASKDLDKLPKKLDLSYSGLDEFKEPEFKAYGSEVSKQESNVVCDKKSDDSKENSDDSLAQAVNTARPQAVNTARPKAVKTDRPNSAVVNAVRVNQANAGKLQQDDTGFVDSGCSRHMTENIAYLLDFKEFDEGYVTFGGGAHGGRIFGKETLKSDSLDFEDVCFVNDLKFNLFSVSQMCDKKNYVLFTDTECLVLSPNFKLPDENQILLKIPRKDNMYNFDMKNVVPKESLTCLVAKATLDESMLWHRRLGHINFKNINKLVKDNLVRGLPTKCLENNQTYVACLKGKQHRASCKSKVLNPITKPLFMLHMDLFGPTFDETREILKNFIKERENLVDKKVKIIRSDNGTEFKNKVMDDFCREKCIKREYSIAKTPQQNGVAERRNRTLIEAARTMLADSKLPTTFWAEAVSTACYAYNRVLVVKPYNKTPYELFRDASYFDSPSKDVDIGEPKSTADDQKQVKDGLDIENDEKDKSDDDSNPKEVNAAGQHVNTASLDVNTGSFKLNVVSPSVNTASSYDQDSPKDMFTMGASHTLEATHVEFFSNEDELEVDLGNIINSYTIPTTPNTRIHKDHPIKNVIGDVKSYVQTRRMTKPTSEQGLNPQALLKLYFILGGSNAGRTSAIQTLTDPDHPNKVYKVVKALYRLYQAPKAWYETLANYLLGNGFKRGKIDQILFIKKQKGDIFLVHVYVDDIIFGSTNKELCTGFEKHMKDNQDKFVAEILKKFNYTDVKSASTPVDLEKPLVKDGDADDVDVHLYRSMIGSLMYLTTSSPDIMFVVCACARFQVTLKTSHLLAVNRIFRYLKGKPTLGLWYSRDSPFELVAYTDSDYARCKKQTVIATSTTEAEYVAAANLLTKGFDAGRHVKRGRDTKIPQSSGPPIKVGDEAVHKELGDKMEMAATTASSLEAEQDSGNINRFETTSK
ncbi:putative ribonuclease H-like domain-containing protein [Tanacetum coccineum]